eukprot:1636325-Pyramimonas_sp.AAC.1
MPRPSGGAALESFNQQRGSRPWKVESLNIIANAVALASRRKRRGGCPKNQSQRKRGGGLSLIHI